MKRVAKWLRVFAGVTLVCSIGSTRSLATGHDAMAKVIGMAMGADTEERAASAARAKDPAWKPAAAEVAAIRVGNGKPAGALTNFCVNAEGNILACYAPARGGSSQTSTSQDGAGIRVYSPDGKLLKTMPLEIAPNAICIAKDGSIFVAGSGKVLKLDAEGKVLISVESPTARVPVAITKEVEDLIKQMPGPAEKKREEMKASMEQRRLVITGLAATTQDVFMVAPTPNAFTYQVYRFNHSLQEPKLVVEKLRGCCGQMDVQAHDDKLWIPHNSRHAVEVHDRDGTQISRFGTKGKVKASDFGGCCEPKNMRVLSNGDVLTAESGPPTCIKRFSSKGDFLGVIATLDTRGECVRVTVDASPDGRRFYMMDNKHDIIRVFAAKN